MIVDLNPRFSDSPESGAHLGKWIVAGVESNDWEGMDSFRTEDKHYLLIGDTGDNFRSRKEVSFLVIEEPLLDEGVREVIVSWQTKFSFPEGPKDVEAVAVDLKGKRAIFLNKRELPLRLYSVPLFPVDDKVTATEIAELVPVPRYRPDLESLYGRTSRYLGLPTGMDLFGNKLLVTTYRNAYLYDYSALDEPPKEISPTLCWTTRGNNLWFRLWSSSLCFSRESGGNTSRRYF